MEVSAIGQCAIPVRVSARSFIFYIVKMDPVGETHGINGRSFILRSRIVKMVKLAVKQAEDRESLFRKMKYCFKMRNEIQLP